MVLTCFKEKISKFDQVHFESGGSAEKIDEDTVEPKKIRIQKRTVISDDEEQEMAESRKKKHKSSNAARYRAKDERRLRVIMDIDEGAFPVPIKFWLLTKYIASETVQAKSGEEATSTKDDVDEGSDDGERLSAVHELKDDSKGSASFIDTKPKKVRKQKKKDKDIPIDSNGRRKRRVVKSRKEKDKKGRTSESPLR